MANRVLETIADPNIDERNLILAVRQLGPVMEPADFWRKIANDHRYSRAHRLFCTIQLFQRHVHPGMKLSELAKVLDNPNWLSDGDIIVIEDVGGFIPVRLLGKNTVVALILQQLSDGDRTDVAIYLSISGRVEREDFIELLRGKKMETGLEEAVLLEIGMTPRLEEMARSVTSDETSPGDNDFR